MSTTSTTEPCPTCGGDSIPGTTCPRGIDCPKCGAAAGQSCRRPSGHRADTLHAERVAIAEQADREREEQLGLAIEEWPRFGDVVRIVETIPPGCTGYVDEFGHRAHDGATCPVHESGDVDRGDELADQLDTCAVCHQPIEPATRYRRENGDPVHMLCAEVDAVDAEVEHAREDATTFAGIPPQLDQLASLARTALTDPPAVGLEAVPRWHGRYADTIERNQTYAVAQLDAIIAATNPAELTAQNAAAVLELHGRAIADIVNRMETDDVIEPGRSMIGDLVHAALDQLDDAIAALRRTDG